METVVIYWNQKQNSIDYHVGNQTGQFDVMIEGLEEDDYVFQVITKDKYGNTSLPVECVGKVLGENYKAGLVNRRISYIEPLGEDGFRIHFAAAIETAVKSVVSLTGSDNEAGVYEIPVEESTLDIPSCEKFSCYTVYLPAANAPDAFNSSTTTVSLGN